MPNLLLERVNPYSELPVLAGVHTFFFLLHKSEVSEDGASLQFRDETVELNIESDEQLLQIIGAMLAKNADRGIIDLFIFFWGNKLGLHAEFSTVADKALEEITATIVGFRKAGSKPVPTKKPRRTKKNG